MCMYGKHFIPLVMQNILFKPELLEKQSHVHLYLVLPHIFTYLIRFYSYKYLFLSNKRLPFTGIKNLSNIIIREPLMDNDVEGIMLNFRNALEPLCLLLTKINDH